MLLGRMLCLEHEINDRPKIDAVGWTRGGRAASASQAFNHARLSDYWPFAGGVLQEANAGI